MFKYKNININIRIIMEQTVQKHQCQQNHNLQFMFIPRDKQNYKHNDNCDRCNKQLVKYVFYCDICNYAVCCDCMAKNNLYNSQPQITKKCTGYSESFCNSGVIRLHENKKPVIYIKTKESTNFKISITLNEHYQFTCIYPSAHVYPRPGRIEICKYDPDGELIFDGYDMNDVIKCDWTGCTEPNGELKINNKLYPYLFYEFIGFREFYDPKLNGVSEIFKISREHIGDVLDECLAIMDFDNKMRMDLITFVLGGMSHWKYIEVQFVFEPYEEIAKIDIVPKMDFINRFVLLFKGYDPIDYYDYREYYNFDEIPNSVIKLLESKKPSQKYDNTLIEWGTCEL